MADVNAQDDVTVTAFNEEDIIVVAISLAGSTGNLAGAGAAAAVDLNNTTYASIGVGATILAGGNLQIHAEDRTDSDLIAGAVGGSTGGGVGASLGLALINKDTQATIGANATVDARGNNSTFEIIDGGESGGSSTTTTVRGVGVSALSTEDMFAVAAAGAGGVAAGVAGSVNWQQINSDTQAYIDTGAQVNQIDNDSQADADQDVFVSAVNQVRTTSIAGAIAGGGAGIGAGLDVGTIANVTDAYIAGNVSARDDVDVRATSDREIFSTAVAGAFGGVTLSGGITLWTIGTDVDGSYTVDGESVDTLESSGGTTADSETEETFNSAVSDNSSSGFEDSGGSTRGDNSGTVSTASADAVSNLGTFSLTTSDTDSKTRAFIAPAATVDAGDDINVIARDETDATMFGGALSIAAGGIGVGAGVSILNIQ